MGNMAQGVAWCARERGVRCTVIVPDVAPVNKIQAIQRLGGHVLRVTFDEWWKAFQDRSYPGLEGEFIHAFDDPRVMEGNGTIAHEILDDLPDPDAVVIPWGGGGLACGMATVFRQRQPKCRIYGCEVATAAPLSASLLLGAPAVVDYQPSFVDGIGSKTVFPSMWERAKMLLDGALVAPVERVEAAVRFLAERARIVAEGAGACALAAAWDADGAYAAEMDGRKIVCVISGGNINSSVLSRILVSAAGLE